MKKISYDCRKKVADARLRIKGRFISKKDSEKINKLVDGRQDEAFNGKNNLKCEFVHAKLYVPRRSRTIGKAPLPKSDLLKRIDKILSKKSTSYNHELSD